MKLVLLLASLASAQDYVLDMKRVFVQSDGKVLVLTVAPNACQEGESKQVCFERIAIQDCPKENGACLPHKDTNKADLPPRNKRDKWRADPQDLRKPVVADNSIILKSERIEALQTQINAEIDKAVPDPIAVLKLQRQLEIEKQTKE